MRPRAMQSFLIILINLSVPRKILHVANAYPILGVGILSGQAKTILATW